MSPTLPKGLKTSFIIHFIVDLIFAIPLFFFPIHFLELLQWQSIDPISARIVAAALFAIGIKSFIERNSSLEIYSSMLSLKIIWSFFATVGLGWSLFNQEFGEPIIGWILFLTFFIFHLVWLYFKKITYKYVT